MPAPASSQFSSNTIYDWIGSFENGMNAGVSPLLLEKNQLAWSSNATVRGSFIHPRPVRRQYTLDLSAVPTLASSFLAGTWLYQGKTYYKPDIGPECLIVSISGNLYKFIPDTTTLIATVTDITGGNPQSATALQCWLIQAENYVIWNDGINLPVFFDGTSTVRSRSGAGDDSNTFLTSVPFTGVGLNTPITLTKVFTGNNGDTVSLSPPSPATGVQPPYAGIVISGSGTTTIVVTFGLGNPNVYVPSGTEVFDSTSGPSTFIIQNNVIIHNNDVPGTTTYTVVLNAVYPNTLGDNFQIAIGSTYAIPGKITAGQGTNTLTVHLFVTADPQSGIYFGPNVSIKPGSVLVAASTTPQVAPLPPQFPAGRMMAYGRGRIWMALSNGKDFIAGDIVSGPSGTKALNFRDAILNITENDFLVGGGTFTVPGSIGDIRAMVFTAQLDVALGQGPLMVFTPSHVFSCNAPVDRLTWQSLTNPILTEAAIGNGGLGQDSTFLVNSDTIYRSVDGMRSLILSTQDFNSWVRTPMSHEVEKVFSRDNQSLLAFGQGVFFDNRILMSASPISTANGVYHQALVSLNTDLVTTVRDKKPPAYDGVWPGMNILGQLTGQFTAVERCFAFVYNTVQSTLELHELMPSSASDVDNPGVTPIVGDLINNTPTSIQLWFESPVLFREQNMANRTFKQLVNGEIMVDKLVGRVDFKVEYKSDQYPCFEPWISFSECSVQNTGTPSDNKKPTFKPRLGLGSPSSTPCDPYNNRPLIQGYNFQVKIIITGQCEFLGARFAAVTLPEPFFSKPNCVSICG